MPSSHQFDSASLNADASEATQALEKAGPHATDLVQEWVNSSNAAAVQEASRHASGTARKAARRGLNVLKSRGVALPPAHKSAARSLAPEAPVAFMMSPDSAGVSIIGITQAVRGGHRASIIYLSEQQGIFRVENGSASPAKVRAQMSKVLSGAGYVPVAVPIEWARHRVATARSVHSKRGTPEPLGFMNAEVLLSPAPETTPEHPFVAEGFVLGAEDAKDMAQDSGALHQLPEFRTWLPSQEAVRELLGKVGERLTPGEKPDNEAVGDFLREETLAATDRFFTPEIRDALVSRMRDAGLSALQRDGEAVALKIAAAIVVIESCGLVTDPPQEVPFLRAFFEKALSFMMAQTGGKLDIPVRRAQPSLPEEAAS